MTIYRAAIMADLEKARARDQSAGATTNAGAATSNGE